MKIASHYRLPDKSKDLIRSALISAQIKLEDAVRDLKADGKPYIAEDNQRVLDKVNAALKECSVTKLEWVYEEDK